MGRMRLEQAPMSVASPVSDNPADTCAVCAFFLARGSYDLAGGAHGVCRRNPHFIQRQGTDWCGEHQRSKILPTADAEEAGDE